MFPTHVLCAELSVWRGDLPHQWPQHGSSLQSPQQRLAGESPRPPAQLRCPVRSRWSPGREVPGEEKRCGASLTYVINQHLWMEALLLFPLFRFRTHRPSALESKEQRRRRSSAQVFCSHQQSAFESEVSAHILSEEAPVQVKKKINLLNSRFFI